jgi:hypothetical protein
MRQKMKNDNIRAVNDHEYDYAVGTIFNDEFCYVLFVPLQAIWNNK